MERGSERNIHNIHGQGRIAPALKDKHLSKLSDISFCFVCFGNMLMEPTTVRKCLFMFYNIPLLYDLCFFMIYDLGIIISTFIY